MAIVASGVTRAPNASSACASPLACVGGRVMAICRPANAPARVVCLPCVGVIPETLLLHHRVEVCINRVVVLAERRVFALNQWALLVEKNASPDRSPPGGHGRARFLARGSAIMED